MFRNLCTRLQRIEIQMLRENGRAIKEERHLLTSIPHICRWEGGKTSTRKNQFKKTTAVILFTLPTTQKTSLGTNRILEFFTNITLGKKKGRLSAHPLFFRFFHAPLYTPHRTAEIRFPSPLPLSGEVLSDLFVAAPSSPPSPLIAI